MKINQGIPAQGSFGLTPDMKDRLEEYNTRKVRASNDSDEDGFLPPPTEEDFSGRIEEEKEEAEETRQESVSVVSTPLENLKKIGVELTDDDFHKIIFRGYLEKEIVVVAPIRGTKPLVATFRTLTGREVDEVDELMAEEVRDVQMTNDGFQTRRSMWIISYGIPQLMGKPVCQPVMAGKDSNKINMKATVKERRRVFSALNPGILTKMMHIHGVFTVSINGILAEPEADYLKKS